jgi:uncharacterized membrane protein YhdT
MRWWTDATWLQCCYIIDTSWMVIRSASCVGVHGTASMPTWFDRAVLSYGVLLPAVMPIMKKIRQATRKIKNRNLAIPAAATAMPVNPNTAATNAITKKITAQRNIFSPPSKMNRTTQLLRVHLNGLRARLHFRCSTKFGMLSRRLGTKTQS